MKPPTYQKEVRKFIGVVNYYCNMWPRMSHMLAPLTRITSNKSKFEWIKVEQDALGKSKRTVSRDTLLTYPYFNKALKFTPMTEHSNLGAVIS